MIKLNVYNLNVFGLLAADTKRKNLNDFKQIKNGFFFKRICFFMFVGSALYLTET